MYNYSDTSESLYQFKRDEAPANNSDLSIGNSKSFKYKAAFVGKTADVYSNNKNSYVKKTHKYSSIKKLE